MTPSPPLLFACLALCALLSLAPAAGVTVLSLDGPHWIVRNANGSVVAPATVPGGVYSDLRAAGVLATDVFLESNDEAFRWVAHDNWTYERSFEVSAELLERRAVQLVLAGVDTVAEVWLNGQRLAAVENMFVRHALDAKHALRAGANRLAVNFTAAPAAARARYLQHIAQRGYAVPPECVPEEYHGECHANHLRKMQASFSWDWGPAFPSVGLWKSAWLEAFDGAVLREVTARFSAEGTALHVRAFLEAGAAAPASLEGSLQARLRLPAAVANASARVLVAPDARGHAVADITVQGFEAPALWWPNGEGEQPLWELRVTFAPAAAPAQRSALRRRVARRYVELVQEPVSLADNDVTDKGLTFYFRVNGRVLFAKGSNWIPASVLPEHGADPARLRLLLQSARDAHMNMLRVWGGGVYESDAFYDLADELGLLVWQDLMFACSMYPADERFLGSVREEVEQQVRRLQTHASVALWAGNNENEGALVDDWYGTSTNYEQYKSDYVTLYAKTIRPLVLSLDPTRAFVVSSPSNGLETDREGYVSKNPTSSLYGDVHYYNYVSDGWNADTFRWTRFASEYGFQSLPAVATLAAAVRNRSELAARSALMISRQHHPDGYEEMASLAAQRLPLPADWDSAERFDAFVYLTQVYQAVAVQTQTEHYRRMRGQLTTAGEGLCMGALFWQLNDVWQAPTWASIDFAGRWKPLQHLATEFFAPQMASAFVDTTGRLHAWALNDRPEPVLQVVLQARAGRWDALPAAAWQNLSGPFTLEPGSQLVDVWRLESLLPGLEGCASSDAARCFVLLRLLALADGLPLGPQREVLPVAPRLAKGLAPAKITVEGVEGPAGDGSLAVRVATDRPAAFVWLEAGALAGRFSRNAFLLADAAASVRFLPRDASAPPSAAQLRSALTVTALAADAVTRADPAGFVTL